LDLGEPLVALALSSPGGLLASVGESGRIYSIEPNSLALQTTFDAPDPVRTLAVDPEGSTTVGTINGQILTIAGDGTLLQTIQLSDAGVPVNGLAYPSDGSQLAAALNNGAVMILDPESGSILQTLPTGSPIRALIYTPDSAILITAGDDGLIRYWDSAEGEPLYTGDIGHSATVNSLAQTEDGIILASGGADAEVKIYDDYSAQWLNTLLGHAGSVEALAFSPDGTLLASGDSTGRLIVWDVIVGQPLLTLDAVHVGGITGLTFTPDGSRLITTGLDGSVQMWGVPPE